MNRARGIQAPVFRLSARRRVPTATAARVLAQHPRTKFTLSGGRAAQMAGTAGNVLLIGSVMTLFGAIMYTLYDNLLSERGTTRIYNESLDLVRANPRIRSLFGTSVVGFGEPSTRHRNRGYAHQESIDALGRKCVSLKYYIVDSKMRNEPELVGEVEAELAESQNTGTWDYNRVTVTAYHTKGALNPEVIPVFVTDEYLREVQRQDELRRNRRFSSRDRGSSDGSWFSTLNPANWRK